ncbi:MAG: acyl-CoA thioesterase [Planctomycetes bacterium]|nr:acyl-CoA thioesterase [Planctomycetota bacterium]
MYKYQTKVRLHHTDAAGVIFFSNLFVFAHECYESFIEQTKSFALFLEEGLHLVPIVHAEADYLLPIGLSQTLEIEMTLRNIGTTSFEIDYDIKNENKETAATAKTVHVVLDAKIKESTEIPQEIRDILEKL